MTRIKILVPEGLSVERATEAAEGAVRIEARKMTVLKELFAHEDIRGLLRKIGKTKNEDKRTKNYYKLCDRMAEFNFPCDEGWEYQGGCNSYFYDNHGSYEFYYKHPGLLTLLVHNADAEAVEEKVINIREKSDVSPLV